MYLACSGSRIRIPHVWGRVNRELHTKCDSTTEYFYLLYFEKKNCDFDVYVV